MISQFLVKTESLMVRLYTFVYSWFTIHHLNACQIGTLGRQKWHSGSQVCSYHTNISSYVVLYLHIHTSTRDIEVVIWFCIMSITMNIACDCWAIFLLIQRGSTIISIFCRHGTYQLNCNIMWYYLHGYRGREI